MGLEKIVSKILADSKAKEQSILADAQKDSQGILADAQKQKAEILDSYKVKAEQSAAQMRAREEAGMEIEVNKKMLSIRREILEDAFEGVLQHFMKIQDSEKRKLYTAMVARLRTEIPSGTIHCRKGEEGMFSGVSGFRVGPPVDTIGGFIAENSDGTLIMDMRLEVLLKEIWDKHLVEVSGLLFPDGEVV